MRRARWTCSSQGFAELGHLDPAGELLSAGAVAPGPETASSGPADASRGLAGSPCATLPARGRPLPLRVQAWECGGAPPPPGCRRVAPVPPGPRSGTVRDLRHAARTRAGPAPAAQLHPRCRACMELPGLHQVRGGGRRGPQSGHAHPASGGKGRSRAERRVWRPSPPLPSA